MTASFSPIDQRSRPASSTRPSARVLAAISEREARTFFSPAYPSLLAGFQHQPSPTFRWRDLLEETRPEVLISAWITPPLPADWLSRPDCPLRYVCHLTGSVRHVVPRSFLEQGGLVTNWGGLAAPQVAEHALLLTLAALRRITDWQPGNREAKFGTRTLYGRRVGLHGFGQVARALCELLRPFGAQIRAYSQGVSPSAIEARGVQPCASLKELFSTSEILIECEALNPQSAGSVTREILAALPDGAVFVNVGRGLVVDEEALALEAAGGRLSVALDVVSQEPLPKDALLATLPTVIYSPHIAGPTGDQFLACGRLALENLRRYENNLPLEAEVTLEIYDRAT